jgi:putative restriction endonuclease
MSHELSSALASRLEKAAVDNGFDRDLGQDAGWLTFASSQSPLRIWLGAAADSLLLVGFSRVNVAVALTEYGTAASTGFPAGVVAALVVADVPTMHRVLRRAFQLSRALPDELLNAFQSVTAHLPRTTEAERLVLQRVGQGIFRQGLLDFWESRCAITGLAVSELLCASHIKPWAHCSQDAERLDVFNGFLLAPHLDAAFDRGFVTVEDDGRVVVSEALDAGARHLLGLDRAASVSSLAEGHRSYLPWHRERVFRGR